VTAFLLQHAIQGWCPPIPILRRFGFRTADEINRERYALRRSGATSTRSARRKRPPPPPTRLSRRWMP